MKFISKSISMDDAYYQRIAKHARKRHMSASGWLRVAADEKLEREQAEDAAKEAKRKKK